jgi:hypothetical protein
MLRMPNIKAIFLCRMFAVWLAGVAALGAHAAPAIHAFNPDSMTRIVASQKGKPFVLVVWSLDCVYCQASLKILSEQKREQKDLRIVTLATDPLDDVQAVAQLNKRLKALGLTAEAWAFGSVPPEHLRYAIDPNWHGEMPRSYWFNAGGERVAHSGVLTVAAIAKLSARPSSTYQDR